MQRKHRRGVTTRGDLGPCSQLRRLHQNLVRDFRHLKEGDQLNLCISCFALAKRGSLYPFSQHQTVCLAGGVYLSAEPIAFRSETGLTACISGCLLRRGDASVLVAPAIDFPSRLDKTSPLSRSKKWQISDPSPSTAFRIPGVRGCIYRQREQEKDDAAFGQTPNMAQPVNALWGLPDKKSKSTPPKCFNIASRVQKSSIEQPLSCRVHPVTVLKILDAYVRRPAGAQRTIGTLLGWISEGSAVDITDSFPVPHKDTTDEGVAIDQDYHKSMLELRQKVSPREVVVGWFSTGDEINATSAVIHAFYCKKESSQFNPTAVLPGPLHLLIDTSLVQQSFGIKTFVNVRTAVAENLLQFHEVPLRVQTSAAEKSSISQLMHARRANREAQANRMNAKDMASLDGLQGGLKELLGLSRRIQQYVRAVQSGKFNAITGLNGSGKSNILDAICFVLGISNLTQVRVGNLSELVYKQGQAGVTKASVTIVFNNEDKQNSPVGYEMHDKIIITRQIVIGGRNRYLLNSHNVQQNQIQNLFHSVSLNVNNPHFLIMQGRITKVINMKPQDHKIL
eukprot:s2445_g5.t1